MALREFTQDEKRRSLYFARLDAKRDAIAYHKTTQKNLQTLKQERDQALKEKEKERLRANQAEAKVGQAETRAGQAEARAGQAETARKRMEDHLRKLGIDPDQI